MSRNFRIICICCLAALLLMIVASCATSPRRLVTLESARRTLQVEYPHLLQNFDLHQGAFTVNEAAWDTLATSDRTRFLKRCSQSRLDVVGSTSVTIRKDDGILATYDGITPVFYGKPLLALGGTSEANSGGAESGPALVVMPRPVYPNEALQAGVEGTVWIKVLVGEDGQVREVVVVGDGIAALNDAAVAAASAARFQPAIEGGAPQPVWVQIPLRFSIMGKHEVPGSRAEAGGSGLASSVSAPTVVPNLPGSKAGK